MADVRNGSHRPPAYFEWWYFHFVSPDGPTINLLVHETDIFGVNNSPYLSLSLLSPGQEPRYFRRSLAENEIARQQPYLKTAQREIEETAETVRFALDLAEETGPGRLRFSGEITKLSRPIAANNGVLYEDALSGRRSHWVVQIAYAHFTGILLLDGVSQRLSGLAYQDHQWGDILIQEFVADWVWGHFSNGRTAVLFFHILTKYGQWIDRVAMVTRAGTFVGTELCSSHLAQLFVDPTPDAFAGTVAVCFLEQLAQLSFSIAPGKKMRCRLNETHGGFLASYIRWSAAAEWELGRTREPIYGITEYVRIRPADYDGGVHRQQHR